jgi:hypothetical protein
MKTLIALGAMLVLFLIWTGTGYSDIPNKSRDALTEGASHAIVGEVLNVFNRTEREQNLEYHYGIAEIAVRGVTKGTDIKVDDRVFVRYWRSRWLGSGSPPPSHYGHRDVPARTDVVEVYLEGDRRTGYDVMSPNGFFRIEKGKPAPRPAKK